MTDKIKTIVQLVAIVILIAIDRIIKLIIESELEAGDRVEVIKGVFSIFHIKNDGAAFSSFSGAGFLLIIIPAAMILCLLFFLIFKREKLNNLIEWGIILISAGGIGNLIDRIIAGVVTDYLSFWSFAVFNFADICVCIGCGSLMIGILTFDSEKKDSKINNKENEYQTEKTKKQESSMRKGGKE